MSWQLRVYSTAVLSLALGCADSSEPVEAAAAESAAISAAPTTVAEAAAKLDLMILPLPDGAKMSGHRRAAELGYQTKTPSQEAFAFVDQQLVERDWKQLPNPHLSGEMLSADYQLDGYLVHVSVFSQQPGTSSVVITHLGNVSPARVPVPASAEKTYMFPAIAMYQSTEDVAATAKGCRETLLAAGWSPYGGDGDTAYYRRNAVVAHVRVMSAPAQENATTISISCAMLSLELPAPPFTENFRYTDGTTAIAFDTDKTPREVADFYREKLRPEGWKSTSEKPFAIKWKEYTIFRNAGQAMITIATHEFEGRSRVRLDHQNAAEFAEEELRGKIAIGEKAKYRDVEWLTVELPLRSDVESTQPEDWAVKISTTREETFATTEQIVKTFEAAGWTRDAGKGAEKAASWPVFREYRLQREERVLSILALKHKKLDPWVAVVGIGGVKLEVAQ